MVDCRKCRDSIIESWKYIKGAHIPAAYFIVESETYMSRDSSKIIYVGYKDSTVSIILFTRDLNLLKGIISAGKTDGFRKTTLVETSPNSTSYIKGEYLLTFNNYVSDNSKSSVALAKNYQVFLDALKQN